MSLKVCANLSFMYPEAKVLLERYSLAKQSGFSAVECAFPYDFSLEELKKAKADSNVEQVLINTYPGDTAKGELGFAAIPSKVNDFRQSLERSVEYAKALDCKRIHVMAGIVQCPTSDNNDTFLKNLKYACGVFEVHGIIGLLEPINHHSVPNYYLNSYDKCVEFLDEINSPHLRLQLDVFHLQQLAGDLTYNIKRLLPYVGHVQIAQVPDRNEPDTPGEINYTYIFELLKQLNYSEWIGLEYKPLGDTNKGLKWMKMLNVAQ